jgi:pyrrolidone-carboxylate peptidase
MPIHKTKIVRLSPVHRLAVVSVLAASALIPVGGAAAADPAPPHAAPPALTGPPPPGVSPRPAAPDSTPPPIGDRPKLKLRTTDAARSGVTTSFTCMPYAFASGTGIGTDEFIEETVGLSYSGGVDCDYPIDAISGEIGLVDRSPAFNGERFDGRLLISSGILGWGYGASAAGGALVRARYYNGARHIEPVLSLTLWAPIGSVWDSCGLVPGMYYYVCSGWGTSVLSVVLGAGVWATGLTQACRDQAAPVDPEQARLTALNGATPASTQILGLIPSIRNRVIAFKRALCATGAAGASGFASGQGQQLWDNAVAEAKNAATQNDDRPLYWARLSMTAAIRQWRPPFPVDRVALETGLDRAARGMNSHDFTLGTAKKVVVSGFDPFSLDSGGITRGNPSAAAVLGLDNTLVNGAEVQVVIFPVRYDDFDAGIVEDTFTRHLAPGPQQATLITTVSQGRGDRFDLERWNGRNRTDGVDNRNRNSGGTFVNPVEPPYQVPGKQFAATTLPVGAMQVGSPFVAQTHETLYQQVSRGSTPVQATAPTPGWFAVEGSVGAYLSNEIAYRVTERRDFLGSSVQAGHVHTPELDVPPSVARRNAIVTQYRQILSAAIGSGGSPVCGEASCTPVQAAYISHYTGAGCTGTESYYTPYFFYDGVRRSWDGRGLAGTTLRTVTNRSWKDANGTCRDDWPAGNTLNDFVTIYR